MQTVSMRYQVRMDINSTLKVSFTASISIRMFFFIIIYGTGINCSILIHWEFSKLVDFLKNPSQIE